MNCACWAIESFPMLRWDEVAKDCEHYRWRGFQCRPSLSLLEPCLSFLTRWCVFVEPCVPLQLSGAVKLPEALGDADRGKSIPYQWITDGSLDCHEKQGSSYMNLWFIMRQARKEIDKRKRLTDSITKATDNEIDMLQSFSRKLILTLLALPL